MNTSSLSRIAASCRRYLLPLGIVVAGILSVSPAHAMTVNTNINGSEICVPFDLEAGGGFCGGSGTWSVSSPCGTQSGSGSGSFGPFYCYAELCMARCGSGTRTATISVSATGQCSASGSSATVSVDFENSGCEAPTPTPTPPPTPTPTPEPTPTPTPYVCTVCENYQCVPKNFDGRCVDQCRGPQDCQPQQITCHRCANEGTANARCETETINGSRCNPGWTTSPCDVNQCKPPVPVTCNVCDTDTKRCVDRTYPAGTVCPPTCNLAACNPTPPPPEYENCPKCVDEGKPTARCTMETVPKGTCGGRTCDEQRCIPPTPTPTPTPPPQPKCVYDTAKGMYTACAVGGTGPNCNEVWDCPMPTTPPPTSTPKPLKCTPTGQCSEYGTGKSCTSAAECETVRCVDSAPYDYVYDACVVCDAAAFPLCNTVNDCLRPGCVVKNGGYMCVPGGMGPSCSKDSDCRCEGPQCGSCVNDQCVIGAHGGKPCTDNSACVDTQTYCVPGQPLCLTRANGGSGIPCASNSACDVCPPGTHRCPVTGQCVPDGQPCPTPTPTATPVCPAGQKQCGVKCIDQNQCCSDSDCPGGRCIDGQCKKSVCGNNIVEPGEQCDAGAKNNDGCSGCNDKCELVVVTEQTCKKFQDCQACGCVEKVALKADSNEEIKIAGDFQPVRYQIRVQNKSNYDPTEILLTDSIQAKQTFVDNKAGYIETPFSTQGYMEYGDKARIVENRNVDGTKVEVWDQFTSSWKSNVGDTVAFLPGGNIGGTSQPPRETRPALRIRNIKHAPNAAGPYSTLVLEYTARARTSFAGHELGKLNNGTDTQFVQIVNEASTTTNNDIYGLIVSKSFVGTGNSGSVYFTGDVDSSDVNKIGGAVGSDQDYFNVSGVFLGAIRNITSYLSTFFGFSSVTDYTEQIGQGTQGVIRGANQGSSSIVSSEDDFGRNLGKRPDGARVYTATNGLTVANSFQVRERSTVIVSQGDLRIGGNITSAPGTNGAVAFVVENGNVIIDGNVSELRATIVAKNGAVIHPVGEPKSPVKLVITGSIYGSIARLIENRTYVGDPSKDADKGAAVAVRYDASILTSPFPGFREAIGDAIFSSVAK